MIKGELRLAYFLIIYKNNYMKYKAIIQVIPAKMINAFGKVVVIADKDLTEKCRVSGLYPDGTRTVPAASQADLKYGYEKLQLTGLIEAIDDEAVRNVEKSK